MDMSSVADGCNSRLKVRMQDIFFFSIICAMQNKTIREGPPWQSSG